MSERDRYERLYRETIAAVAHERALNRAYERRCPSARPSEAYRRGPLPGTRFFSEEAYAAYLVRFERAKFYPSKPGT